MGGGFFFFILRSMAWKGGMGADRYLKFPKSKRETGQQPLLLNMRMGRWTDGRMDIAFLSQSSNNISKYQCIVTANPQNIFSCTCTHKHCQQEEYKACPFPYLFVAYIPTPIYVLSTRRLVTAPSTPSMYVPMVISSLNRPLSAAPGPACLFCT